MSKPSQVAKSQFVQPHMPRSRQLRILERLEDGTTDQASRWWRWSPLAAALAALLVFGWFNAARNVEPAVTHEVITPVQERWISTENEPTTIEAASGLRVRLSPRSRLGVNAESSDGVLLTLTQGEALLEASAEHRTSIVRASTVEVRLQRGRARLRYTEEGGVRVESIGGTLRVSADGEPPSFCRLDRSGSYAVRRPQRRPMKNATRPKTRHGGLHLQRS